eukprot:111875-Hanusia_phi.AAC.5
MKQAGLSRFARSVHSGSTRVDIKNLLARAQSLHEQGHLNEHQYIVASHSGKMALEHHGNKCVDDTRIEILREIVSRGTKLRSEELKSKMRVTQTLQEYMELPDRQMESARNPLSSCTIS